MKSIGENIREIREGKRISQYAVAYSMDMSQAAYSKIERGETEVKASHLYKLAAIFGVSVYDLLPPSLASSFEGNDYLLKPIIQGVKRIVYRLIVAKRMKKLITLDEN